MSCAQAQHECRAANGPAALIRGGSSAENGLNSTAYGSTASSPPGCSSLRTQHFRVQTRAQGCYKMRQSRMRITLSNEAEAQEQSADILRGPAQSAASA